MWHQLNEGKIVLSLNKHFIKKEMFKIFYWKLKIKGFLLFQKRLKKYLDKKKNDFGVLLKFIIQ